MTIPRVEASQPEGLTQIHDALNVARSVLNEGGSALTLTRRTVRQTAQPSGQGWQVTSYFKDGSESSFSVADVVSGHGDALLDPESVHTSDDDNHHTGPGG